MRAKVTRNGSKTYGQSSHFLRLHYGKIFISTLYEISQASGQVARSPKPPQEIHFGRRDDLLRRRFKDDVIRPDEYVDICPNCGRLFTPNLTGRRKRFCSDKCRLIWHHRHPHSERWKDTSRIAICPVCKKEFVATREYKTQRKYCSRACANTGRKREMNVEQENVKPEKE